MKPLTASATSFVAVLRRRLASAAAFEREHGRKALVEEARIRIGASVTGSASRSVGRPSLRELSLCSKLINTSPAPLLQVFLDEGGDARLSELCDEYGALEKELVKRQRSYSPAYPAEYRIGMGGALLLYALVRLTKPTTVLETGVADGYSSFFILHALSNNGSGQLISCDTSSSCGAILSSEEKREWCLETLDSAHTRAAFLAVVARAPRIDLFIHDSDHSYRWQTFELESIVRHLDQHGMIVCDDADASYAFVDFATRIGVPPLMLVEDRKVVGVLQL